MILASQSPRRRELIALISPEFRVIPAQGEEILPEVIGSCQLSNPGEIAGSLLNFCIHQCKGRIRDDMTILVIGIWKKEEE